MKLSVHHASHGLDAVLTVHANGERLRIPFPKGKFSLPVTLEVAGQRFETRIQLTQLDVGPEVDADMSISWEVPEGSRSAKKGVLREPVKSEPPLIGQDGSPIVGDPPPSSRKRPDRHLIVNGLPPAQAPLEPPPREKTSREERTDARDMAEEAATATAPIPALGGTKKRAARAART